jgi:hypothetical protein
MASKSFSEQGISKEAIHLQNFIISPPSQIIVAIEVMPHIVLYAGIYAKMPAGFTTRWVIG